MSSIKHPPGGPSLGFADAPANLTPVARLPNFCNLGIMLRLLLIVNLLCVAAAAVRSNGQDGWEQFLLISAVAQPVIILSLVTFCGLRSPPQRDGVSSSISSKRAHPRIHGTFF